MADDKPSPPPGSPNIPPVPPSAITAVPMDHPPIPLASLAPVKAAPPAPALPKKEPDIKDTFRELIETIVFVVVLVLMLKTFLAEAFVIPTGSMANTLLGYHHKVACDQCGYPNLVNASSEAEPPNVKIVRGQCINCKHMIVIRPELVERLQP